MLKELRKGGTNAEIAIRLGLSPETVKTHIAHMLSKLDLRDRRELAAFRQQEERGRGPIFGAIGLPFGLSLSMRPLVWAGVGLAGAVGIAGVVVFIAAVVVNVDQPPAVPLVSTPAAEATPSPSATPPAATGTPAGYALTVTEAEGGSVTVSPAARDDGTYAPGTVVTLSAAADKGYDFSAWTGLPQDATVTAGPAATTTTSGTETSTASFTVTAPVAVAASFRVESTPYNLHTTGTVMAAGSYAFLSDVSDLKSVVEWPRTDVPAGLLTHMLDAGSTSRAAYYGTISVGDRVDLWRGHRCFIRFKVVEVRPDPGGTPARKLFGVDYVGSDVTGCDGPELTDVLQPVAFHWRQPPWLMGADGVREVFEEPVPGPGRYRLDDGLIVTIPAGMRIRVSGFYDGGWFMNLRDVESGSSLSFNEVGEEAGRKIIEPASGASGEAETGATTRDVNALFDQIVASVEVE